MVIAAVAGVLGLRLAIASAAARPVPVPEVSARSPATGGSPGPTDAAQAAVPLSTTGPPGRSPAGSAPGARSPTVLVHVAGRVHRPGVVRLPVGARVQDALRAAGGALPGSDLVGINLAQLLADGEQVVVARPGRGSTVTTAGAGTAAAGAAGASAGSGAMVDLNVGDVTALDALPGVGPVLAQRIVDWRTAHGRFTSIDELDEVSGIGAKLLAEIRPHVRL